MGPSPIPTYPKPSGCKSATTDLSTSCAVGLITTVVMTSFDICGLWTAWIQHVLNIVTEFSATLILIVMTEIRAKYVILGCFSDDSVLSTKLLTYLNVTIIDSSIWFSDMPFVNLLFFFICIHLTFKMHQSWTLPTASDWLQFSCGTGFAQRVQDVVSQSELICPFFANVSFSDVLNLCCSGCCYQSVVNLLTSVDWSLTLWDTHRLLLKQETTDIVSKYVLTFDLGWSMLSLKSSPP